MAAPQAGRLLSQEPAAHVVGNSFVQQYYNVLHLSPHLVQHFYTDKSKLTRAEAGESGNVDSAESQQEIHDKILSIDFGTLKAEIKTVDSQHSLSGGVIVMVTGSLTTKDAGKRNFAQSFFLAPQEKGYYVLNDIFRYLDGEPPVIKAHAAPTTNGILEPALEPSEDEVAVDIEEAGVAEAHVTEPEEIADEPVQVEGDLEGEDEVEAVEEEADIIPVVEESLPPPELPVLAPSPPEEPKAEEKKSYASILRVAREIAMAPPSPLPVALDKPRPASGEVVNAITAPAQAQSSATPSPASARAPVAPEPVEEPLPEVTEQDARSVFVKNLPLNVTSEELEQAFAKFGVVKFANIKNQKPGAGTGSCYAFVEFTEPAAAIAAIQASPVYINGRAAHIEEKKPLNTRPRNRGGLGGGRGQDRPMYRGGDRGRGPYGNRGGRGANTGDRDGSNRGRGIVGLGGGRGGTGATPGTTAVPGVGGDSSRIGAGERRPGSGDGVQGDRGGTRQPRRAGGSQAPGRGGGVPSSIAPSSRPATTAAPA
eukprot:TRINITY_DN2663_c0_g1_i1.p1 TRINITY_DN2663_c0_g1~~TRINITY_DN2663_c0_g1_i1.p1  ORF type:complete len:538 (+),score=108.24 TRINITY_DN2663_c0_g1_i1:179-1792(+)